MSAREKIWDLVAQSCMHLDSEQYDSYLELLDDSYEYIISCFSPDLRKEMVLLQLNKDDLGSLLKNIHNHIHLPGKLFRQASLYSVERKPDDRYLAMSYVMVTYTNLDGASAIFCVGRYHDHIAGGENGLRLMSRRFEMETRDIGTGCHYPI
jgi:methanesulfonate monooxygenase small subunit